MRGSYTVASCLALATAIATFAAPAYAQQPPTRVTEGPRGAAGDVVVIYGDRDSSDPGAYSVIGEQEIAETAANHPAEILNTVPGVNVQMNSGQELLVAIRSPVLPAGAGQGSFLILENGIPTRAPAFGNVNALFEVHHETAEAIEVVRDDGGGRDLGHVTGSLRRDGLLAGELVEVGGAVPVNRVEELLVAHVVEIGRASCRERVSSPV